MFVSVLKGMGFVIVAVMLIWVATTNVTPNHVVGRIIMGLLMLILAYLIEIRNLLKER
jgi:hypothetical protein